MALNKGWVWARVLFKGRDRRIQYAILRTFSEIKFQNYTRARSAHIAFSILRIKSKEDLILSTHTSQTKDHVFPFLLFREQSVPIPQILITRD